MKFKTDFELLNDFSTARNLKKITVKAYNTSMKLYSKFNNQTFVDLIDEAEYEENQSIRWKNRRLKERLLNFRNFLTLNYRKNYARVTLSRVLTIYKHYEIEIHKLPSQSSKNYNESTPVTFNDLPTKSIIKNAVNSTTPVMRALILFMVSSGCARRETLDLTIQDFINATGKYHDRNNIKEIIAELEMKKNIIPTFRLKRQKTNKYYFTFCSHEATFEIINYLKSRKSLKNEDKLFEIHYITVSRNFIRINDELKLGKVGNYNRFRSHMLRKFHASSLKNDGMHIEDINSLQGKSKNMIDEAYYFENPESLKREYIAHVNAVIIYDENKIRKPKAADRIFQKTGNT